MAIRDWFRSKKKNTGTESTNRLDALYQRAAIEASVRASSISAEMSVDDIGWRTIDGLRNDGVSEHERREIVRRARRYVIKNPIAKQTVSLYQDYGVGIGIRWNTSDRAKAIISAVTDNPLNKPVMSMLGQRAVAAQLVKNGELFIACYGFGPDKVFRSIEPLEISEVLTDPNDTDTVRGFVRDRMGRGGGVYKKIVYRAIENTQTLNGENSTGSIVDIPPDAVPMYYIKLDGDGVRGHSLFSAGLELIKAQWFFMRDRVAIQRAVAVFTSLLKAKGATQEEVDELAQRFSSEITHDSPHESNPRKASGSSLVTNDRIDYNIVPQDTAADNARTDNDMLLTFAGMGAGIFPQYYGSGTLQNYAQANTMEGPLYKRFEAFQQIISDLYSSLFRLSLEDVGITGDAARVDIELPPIIRRDTPAMLDGITKTIAHIPALGQSEEVVRQLLLRIGMPNIDSVMDDIKDVGLNPIGESSASGDGIIDTD